MLQIENLRKTYRGGVMALRGVSLSVPAGMFGLLGPNGAGKSTLMRAVATLLEPDDGRIQLDGLDVVRDRDKVRAVLGYLPQDFGLYPSLTALEMLDYLASLKGITERGVRARVVEALLERVNLSAVKKRRLGGFSGGMRQRFGIAQALLGAPRLLVVDEPTAGLDPEERLRFQNLLAELAQDIVILLSTHIVSDVTALCPRMAILREGQVVFQGTPAEAVASLRGKVFEKTVPRGLAERYRARFTVISANPGIDGIRLRVLHDDPHGGHGPQLRPGEDFEGERAFQPSEPTLEDVYFQHVHDASPRSVALLSGSGDGSAVLRAP
jgi:ABC-type multidrug transport system ATPase subunit